MAYQVTGVPTMVVMANTASTSPFRRWSGGLKLADYLIEKSAAAKKWAR